MTGHDGAVAADGVALDGKVALVTGAGAGLGRSEALALARAGAHVVVNDVSDSIESVVAEIEELGVRAAAVVGDVGEARIAETLVATAVERFGGVDVVVNNAGVLRDRMVFSMSDQEWDDVVRVHLRGHFLVTRSVCAHWRQLSKESGQQVYGRIVNTASEASLFGAAGQPNYAAAKAGITALTVSTARAMARYGVRANVICPRARTGMTEHVFGELDGDSDGVDALSTEHVSPLVAYLASPAADAINGQLFVVHGGMVVLMSAPAIEARFDAADRTWTTDELHKVVGEHFVDRDPDQMFASMQLASLP
ncbi:3-oxoacyl-ACP reductase [Allosaccharopolyspora coralli]|uniref:3-oxoacyl-ACP reductase n=1 Tax=Allosaccharopolyspora coralli TaxID=2665642 RepID=A0A5Q3QAG6_9PSEU|nr:3-oxoacyl-ACP reductase [Allosaccharopolyspora coralli]QGK70356.1 3-oxoacyl-ACP reductase [Allosaccharopolyspora coralli]